jgi:hypothetical protein
VFLQTIQKEVVARFKELCLQGMYNISEAKRGQYAKAMGQYEEKLSSAIQLALKHGVSGDEIGDEAFSLCMERHYEARRLFQATDVDHSGCVCVVALRCDALRCVALRCVARCRRRRRRRRRPAMLSCVPRDADDDTGDENDACC